MLLPRFLTALVGVPLLLSAVYFGQFPYFLLIFGVVMLALHEYFSLAEEAGWPVFKKLGMILGAALVLALFFFGTKMGWALQPKTQGFLPPLALSLVLALLLIGAMAGRSKEEGFPAAAATLLGLFYIGWTLSHLILLRDLRPNGMRYTFFLFVVIWTLDVGAYFGGMRFGRHKLSEAISPKKSWEGVASGSLLALLAALLCRKIFLNSIGAGGALALGLLIVVLAQLSDLSESLFKRNVRVKDSGTLLPGHGGILDRFDSFLLTAPVFYYSVLFYFE